MDLDWCITCSARVEEGLLYCSVACKMADVAATAKQQAPDSPESTATLGQSDILSTSPGSDGTFALEEPAVPLSPARAAGFFGNVSSTPYGFFLSRTTRHRQAAGSVGVPTSFYGEEEAPQVPAGLQVAAVNSRFDSPAFVLPATPRQVFEDGQQQDFHWRQALEQDFLLAHGATSRVRGQAVEGGATNTATTTATTIAPSPCVCPAPYCVCCSSTDATDSKQRFKRRYIHIKVEKPPISGPEQSPSAHGQHVDGATRPGPRVEGARAVLRWRRSSGLTSGLRYSPTTWRTSAAAIACA